MRLGPHTGTPEYEEQAQQVSNLLRTLGAQSAEDEDKVIALFAVDRTYSRAAIMDGVGRWRSERLGR